LAYINIRLDKNFTTAFNRLRNKYGKEIARLNGFADSQLSYTDFIDNFVDTETVADASVDCNANVGHKDIVTLLNEMPKPHRKLLAYNKIYYEINKKYGFQTANQWIEKEWNKTLYMHDADTSSFKPYCYKGEEMLTIKYNNIIYYLSFKELYDFIDDEEQYDESIKQNAKFPKGLYVLDLIDEKACWTKVQRLVKHSNKKPMRFIKYANGLSQIVTEDHPIITERGDIPAKEVTTEDRVYSYKSYTDYNLTPIDNEILTKDFGWIVGMCLAEATASPSQVSLRQSEPKQREKLLNLLNKLDIPYTLLDGDKINLKVSRHEKFIESILLNTTSVNKKLPLDYIYFPDEFMDGVVAGLIDGDGTIDGYKNRHCQIRIASEELCHQISHYLSKHNVFCSDRIPFKYYSEKSFKQNYPLFGIGFSLTNEDYFSNIGSIKINDKYEPLQRKGDFKNKKYQYNYGWVNIIENVEYIDKCDTVYDITTETGHFICNDILSHNCYAYDLKELAEKGLFFLENFNSEPPKHLGTFIDFVKEFVSYVSNRTSGAAGLPNLIPYMYYFWREDVKNNYYTETKEKYARQHIQRFIYAVNQPCVRDNMQSAFTNTNIFDRPYLEALFGGAEFPDGSFMIDDIDGIMEFQKLFLEVMSEIRSKNMFTFPVNTISLLKQDGKFVDEDFARYASEHNRKWNDSNFFVDSTVNSLSNCCRLKSNIEDLGFFSSIGGTALRVGSVKVSTMNIARLALEHDNEKDFMVALRDLTELNLKALDVVRSIIVRNVEKGLLPNYAEGLIDIKTQYNTIGVIGIYEALKTFGYTKEDEFGNTFYTDEAFAFAKKLFSVIHTTKDHFALDKDYMINIEAIPGESAAVKMQAADEIFYPETVVKDLPLYGNQFIPLGIKTTLRERIRIASAFDKYCNGGSILHVNIEAPFQNEEQAWNMLNYITDQGVTYFAFNTKIQACEYNHAFFGKKCPECGGPVATEYTRIVGFYTPIKTWSKKRKEEYELREWEEFSNEQEVRVG